MGRRSINTTKSGKYMNPTDQHRKEARKRELRKNKKQRLIVRTAVLKGKDPYQIIADMERLDQMEYNVSTPPPLNEKVLKDKRRKMKETWDRLLRLYNKEDHQRFVELKRMEVEYEAKRNQMMKFFESVKSAQEVTIDDIPLPSAAPTDPNLSSGLGSAPMFPNEHSIPQSILKRPHMSSTHMAGPHRTPPGVPPGPPPVLSDGEDDVDDDSDDDEKERNKRIRFSDDPIATEKDSDVNEFLKELEQMEQKSGTSSDDTSKSIQSLPSAVIASLPTPVAAAATTTQLPLNAMPPPPSLMTNIQPSGRPPVPPPQMMLFRPPGHQPGMRSSSQPPNMAGLMVGRPPMGGPMPGPPPPGSMRPGGPPPHRMMGGPRPPLMGQPMRPPMGPPSGGGFPGAASAQMAGKRDDKKAHVVSDRATIEAKPQLRNLSADATRFTPVALRVKRDDKVVKKSAFAQRRGFGSDMKRYAMTGPDGSSTGLNAPTKGDAYDQFMKEMENLL